jgi:hypothetical protein
MATTAVKQRADYTFKFNRDLGRHGWLRLTPAYSVKLVEEILQNATPGPHGPHVVDPFSGTATTPLCAANHGFPVVGYELNPFLVWFGKAKTDIYSEDEVIEVKIAAKNLVERVSKGNTTPCEPPPIHNIGRWWNSEELSFLCKLKSVIDERYLHSSQTRTLLLVCFCRVVIKLSNAAFNHQSMSFKDKNTKQLELLQHTPDFGSIFLKEMELVLPAARQNPQVKAEIIQGDSRDIKTIDRRKYDLLITSPPYPNRMSYIRELRPYMYWLGYLSDGRDAGELDWQAIGGTWGIATSRLADWQRSPEGFYPDYFVSLLSEIAHGDNKNGKLLSNYVAKYFEDMWRHLQSVYDIIKPDGCVHYIIGNSTFYNILLPVERLYKDMVETLGFTDVQIHTIRKRNSKKALFEFDVTGIKK